MSELFPEVGDDFDGPTLDLGRFIEPPRTLSNAEWPPTYVEVFAWRQQRLLEFRRERHLITGAREYYRTRPVEFINHWCVTYDPRKAGGIVPAKMPFILFERQAELIEFLLACVTAETSGLVEKCRDMGATWLCAAFSIWLWLYWPGAAVGWGSRKETYVDKIGDPDSIFEKMRIIINSLPVELRPRGFSADAHMTFMKFINPETGATITGEAGDNIGRGGRKLIYFKDESAHYERPEKIEAALGDNTRVQIDISSVNGLGNVFHRRRESGIEWVPGQPATKDRTNVFVMDWRDHPEKSVQWYEARRKKFEDEGLQHVFAQEVDRNYASAVEGIVVPPAWVRAAIDAHKKLGLDDSGPWGAALDVADEGGDTNALAKRKGIVLKAVDEWGERDTGATTRRAIAACEGLGPVEIQYDCIGVGAGVKSEANRLQDDGLLQKGLRLVPWNAAASALFPDRRLIQHDKDSPFNKDFYQNLKAQAWWELRRRFEKTWRALNEPGFTWEPDELISLPSELPLLRKLEKELSQPTAGMSTTMKLLINKKPEGTKSPNLADAVVMAFWPAEQNPPIVISDAFLRTARLRRR